MLTNSRFTACQFVVKQMQPYLAGKPLTEKYNYTHILRHGFPARKGLKLGKMQCLLEYRGPYFYAKLQQMKLPHREHDCLVILVPTQFKQIFFFGFISEDVGESWEAGLNGNKCGP